MPGVLPPRFNRPVTSRPPGGLWCLALALLGVSRSERAQDRPAMFPPPHFAAAGASGTLLDLSPMGSLRNRVTLDLANVPIDTALIDHQGARRHFFSTPTQTALPGDLLPRG